MGIKQLAVARVANYHGKVDGQNSGGPEIPTS